MRIYGHVDGQIQQLVTRLADLDVGLRWGGPQVPDAINGQVHLLDGLEQLRQFEAKEIPCPPFCRTFDIERQEGIWLARKTNHTQGRDIIQVGQRVRGRRKWQDSDFFVKYVPAVNEWRFHIFKGNSIARGLKTAVRQVIANDPIIRSRRNGWHLRHDIDPPKGLRTLAKQAVEAVGYELGAVDILELTDGTGCVLEVNSRPAIRDDYTLAAYERAFRQHAVGV